MDVPGHPGLLVGLNLDVFVLCDSKSLCENIQLLVFKHIPVEVALLLLRATSLVVSAGLQMGTLTGLKTRTRGQIMSRVLAL